MKVHGIKRLAFMSGQVHEIELFKPSDLVWRDPIINGVKVSYGVQP